MGITMRKMSGVLICFFVLLMVTGCRIEKKDAEKIKELEFTVMEKDEIPNEMEEMIEKRKKELFQITFGDKETLYIGQGYGEQPTSGYSVSVDSCYEAANAVYIHTSLLGPGSDEKISEKPTCPYVVVKIKENEKHVIFQSK